MTAFRAAVLSFVVLGLGSGVFWYRAHHRAALSAAAEEDAPEPGRPRFGMNLAQVADWGREWGLVDVFKPSRPWVERGTGPFAYDARGNPRLMPGQAVETLLVREIDGHYPAGRYVATWRGTGRVKVPGFDVTGTVREQPGRLEFDVTPGNGGIQLVVTASDRRDPVRDIHVWMPGFEDAKSPFHPLFLERLRPFEVLRFMGWQQTNNSPVRTWAQRAKPDDARYSTDAGAPVEVLVDLANELRVSPWFCVPHQADDDYVRRFAQTVRERLRPELKVYVEYSNEVWNLAFQQAKNAQREGQRRGLGDLAGARFYAQRSVEVFRIWEEVFGGRERLVRVLASQAVNPWLSEQILTWQDAAKHADALAVAPYFGNELGDPKSADAVARLTVDQIMDYLTAEVDGPHREHMRAQARLARKYGLELIAYEGGQHLAGYSGAENNEALTALFIAANRSPRMYDLTRRHLEHWFAAGGGMHVAFNYVQGPSKWGSWGVLEYQDQPVSEAPKYRAVLDVAARDAKGRP